MTFPTKAQKKCPVTVALNWGSHTGVFTTEKYNIIWYLTVYYRRQLQLSLLSYKPFVYSVSNVCRFTDRYILYWLSSVVSFWNVTPAQIVQSSSREYKQKLVSDSMWTQREGCVSLDCRQILTSQSRRGQSRCPAVWPPHAAQKDWSCWGADRAWTTQPWAGHRADILQSSPKNNKKGQTIIINWT